MFDEPSGLKELVEEETPKEKQQQPPPPPRESRRRHDRKKEKAKEEEKGEEEKPADTSMSQEQIEQVMIPWVLANLSLLRYCSPLSQLAWMLHYGSGL